MNTRDEKAGKSVSASSWFGFDQLRLTDDANAVTVTIGSTERWDKAHLRRLRQSADLPGLVPVIDSDTASDGKPYAVTPVIDAPRLADRIPPKGSEWEDCAAITEAAARATHEAHLRGLFHGSLAPDQIYVLDGDVAVGGIGLGLGGIPSSDYDPWVAPEVRDGHDATERSDVYSLGKILEASLGASLESVPRSVRRLIMWSSSDTPEARPPSALEFASILAEALGEERKTYSPAFIPTTEITDLASTASEAVAAYVPSPESGSGGLPSPGAAAAGAGAVGGATLASSILSGDEPPPEARVPTVDTPTAAEQVEPAEPVTSVEPTEEPTDEAGPAEEPQPVEEAATTSDLAAPDLSGAPTTELDEGDLTAAGAAAAQGSAFDTRRYGEDIRNVLEEDDGYDVPAARTVDLDGGFESERRGNRAGIVIGAILAAGLGVIAYQLLSSDDESTPSEASGAADTSTSSTIEEPTTSVTEPPASTGASSAVSESSDSTEATTTTAEATTTTAEATTTTAEATTTTAETTTTTAATSSTTAPAAPPAELVTGPIASDEAAVQLLHGIPGVEADVYVNGEALAPAFAPGTIAGPADLPAGTYDIAVYAASDSAPAAATDRTDEPLISQSVTIGADPTTLVAHLDADGNPTISSFPEDLSTLAPASSRVEVRHLAAAPAVELSIDGNSAGTLEPGKAISTVLEAGEHTIAASTADGDPVKTATLTLADGELASISLIGSVDDGIEVAVQRYTGLSSAPQAVPTGDSNLLAESDDPTGLYLLAGLASLMAAAGGLVLIRRNRRVL